MSDSQDTSANSVDEPVMTMGSSIFKSVWGLALFAIVTAGLIALTQVGTKEQIDYQIKQARSKALLQIVPLDEFNNDLLEDAFTLDAIKELGLSEPSEGFVAKQDGLPVYLILPIVAPEGYSGPIRLIMSMNLDGEIAGVRVIEHKETPGLGDKIDIKKSDWIRSFEGRSLENLPADQWKVEKDGGQFDQLTGATITPRAIVKAVYQALVYFDENYASIMSKVMVSKVTASKVTPKEMDPNSSKSAATKSEAE